ncbi:uncharacterized protein [Phyllobates terribilis]|uniref:uncharacterized protein n=1 Tax=Phyllobates terribilis TaxID=111132 RepID=UPI003CCB6323
MKGRRKDKRIYLRENKLKYKTETNHDIKSFTYLSKSRFSTDCDKVYSLQKVLKDAATDDHTVIITTLNEAWSAPNTIFDLFLESFRIGDHTKQLLNHMIVVAFDEKAFARCLNVHGRCFALTTDGADFSKEAYFMTPDYLKMMWKRIDFLRSVLELGYSFVFTDSDVMWFRNPFPHFYPDVDFQIACDHFFGNSSDLHNRPNGGFSYVRSNKRSVAFYNFWYSSQTNYPGYHDQDVLNFIKRDPFISEIGLTVRFLNTAYFGGLCEPSENFNLVCTMHANCCYGMDSKLIDLKIMLQDWKEYVSLPPRVKRLSGHSWGVPKNCSLSSSRYPSSSLAEEEEDDQS